MCWKTCLFSFVYRPQQMSHHYSNSFFRKLPLMVPYCSALAVYVSQCRCVHYALGILAIKTCVNVCVCVVAVVAN